MNQFFKSFFVFTLSVLLLASITVTSFAATLKVKNGRNVKVHYTLTIDGKVIQTTRKGEPLEYLHGERKIVPGLAKELLGMKKGKRKTVTVSSKDGYGELNTQAFREIAKSRFPTDLELRQGLVVEIAGVEGAKVPGIVWEVRDETVVINFNHPLAGKTLNFDIEVMDVTKNKN